MKNNPVHSGGPMRFKPVSALFCAAFACLALATTPALAQRVAASDLMPPPKAAPRTTVKTERLPDTTPAQLQGFAQARDSSSLTLQATNGKTYDIRLIGLLDTPLTDPKGLAARVALDSLVQDHALSCTRRDRDRDGLLMVNCTREDGLDIAALMLRGGVTLFTRNGNLNESDTQTYRAAESEAQAARRGLWASVPQLSMNTQRVTTPENSVKENNPNTISTSDALGPVIPAATVPAKTTKEPVKQAVKAAEATSLVTLLTQPQPISPLGLLLPMLATMLLGFGLFDYVGRRRARYTHELDISIQRQSLAAALGGELAAARDVCENRGANLAAGGQLRWPRLRSYVYQTHVEKIGLLGPFLARQVASLYGQMADYAHHDKDETNKTGRAAMIKSLARLCGYIEIVLEGFGALWYKHAYAAWQKSLFTCDNQRGM
jgi:endonuclease YncB( thermonuclease family)